MPSYPHPNNDYALPGGAIKTVVRDNPKNKTSSRMMEWQLSYSNNTQQEDKNAKEGSVCYLAKGAISVEPSTGGFRVAKLANATTDPEFSINTEDSQIFSKLKTTTLGSTTVETIDGYVLHPLGLTTPSTPFSPTKGWLSQFFPAFLGKGLITISILELVQFALLKSIAGLDTNNTVTNTTERDLGTIIVENPDVFYPPRP